MKIVLLGANGRTGREVLKLALASGDSVTALVRDKAKLSDIQHPNLFLHEGDVCDPVVVGSILSGQDVVISTLGPRSPLKSACLIYSRSAASIVKAMENSDVDRLLVISTALLFPPRKVSDHILRFVARHNARQAKLMEDRIRASRLNWCIARVGFLNSKSTDNYQSKIAGIPEGTIAIPRAAVARFLYAEARENANGCRIVGLSG